MTAFRDEKRSLVPFFLSSKTLNSTPCFHLFPKIPIDSNSIPPLSTHGWQRRIQNRSHHTGHGLMVIGCWWKRWRFWGIDGNKVWSLGFLRRRRRVRDSFSRRETPSFLAGLDSRWVKEAMPRNWASLGLAQIWPTYRSAGPGWT